MAEVTETLEVKTTESNEPVINPFEGVTKKEQVSKVIDEEEQKEPVLETKQEENKEEKPNIASTTEPIVEKAEVKKEAQKFANKTSESIYNSLIAGEEDKVLSYLSKKKAISSIDSMTPEQKIKLNLKNTNEGLSDTDIQDLFEERFSAPEPVEQRADELDEDFEERVKKYDEKVAKYQRRLEREGKSASTELQKQIEELVFPDSTKTNVLEKNGQTQEELDDTSAKREVYLNSIDKGLSDFKSIDVIYKDKEVEIPVAYSISKEERQELKDTMENFNLEKFIQDRWISEDGQFNTKQQAKDLFLLTHGEKAIAALVDKVGTKRYAEAIKAQKNINFSGTRSGNLEPSAQEAMDKAAAHFYNN